MSTLAEVEASVNAKAKEVFGKENATFTRSKGGTAEREELISQIQLPDLYLLAEEIIRPGNRILKENRERFADMLIGTWHLAHDMKRHLQSNS